MLFLFVKQWAVGRWRSVCGVGTEVASSGRLVAVELAGMATSGRLAVVLPRGRRVEVSEGFDAATLERLLAVLEQA